MCLLRIAVANLSTLLSLVSKPESISVYMYIYIYIYIYIYTNIYQQGVTLVVGMITYVITKLDKFLPIA